MWAKIHEAKSCSVSVGIASIDIVNNISAERLSLFVSETACVKCNSFINKTSTKDKDSWTTVTMLVNL